MENLFATNNVLLYLVLLIFISVKEFSEQKLVIVTYILSFLLISFNLMEVKNVLLIILVYFFIYLEYLNNDDMQTQIIKKPFHKIFDYIFKMIFDYYIISYLITILISRKFLYQWLFNLFIEHQFLYNLIFNLINLVHGQNKTIITIDSFQKMMDNGFIKSIPFIISIFLLSKILSDISSKEFSVKPISKIIEKLDSNVSFNKYKTTEKLSQFYFLLTQLEDKSYFIRTNEYTVYNFTFAKYKYVNINNDITKRKKKNFLQRHILTVIKIIKLVYYDMERLFSFITRKAKISNAHSTLEMQLIKNLAVESLYSRHQFKRFFYELFYSRIILSGHKEYLRCNTEKSMETYKEYLLFKYINVCRSKINSDVYNIQDYMNERKVKNIEDLSLEEFFVWCLGLPHYVGIGINVLISHHYLITTQNLNIKKICQILNLSKQNTKEIEESFVNINKEKELMNEIN